MAENFKPFVCSEPGCNEGFTNEDHLLIHGIVHHSHLTSATGHGFIGDQTPTPTKFLKSCEEIGLFQEFAKNPFDEAFKRAAEQHNASVEEPAADDENLPVFEASGSSVLPQSVTELLHDDQNEIDVSADTESHTYSADTDTVAQIFCSPDVSASAKPTTVARVMIPINITLPGGQALAVTVPADLTIPSGVLLSSCDVMPSASATNSVAGCDSADAAVLTDSANGFTALSGSGVAAIASVPTSSVSLPLSTPKYQPTTGIHHQPIADSTREKLKATVHSMQQRSTLPSVANSAKKIPPLMISPTSSGLPSTRTPKPSGVQLQAADTSTPSRLAESMNTSDDDSQDRLRFLERQRAAANRCRQKKKQYVTDLEVRVAKLNSFNRQLQTERQNLIAERNQLRALLAQHRSCPAMTSDALTLLVGSSVIQNWLVDSFQCYT